MGSRLRENPSHLIECWCEVVAPRDSNHPPWIIQKFPRSYSEKEVLKCVPQFTFPCSFDKVAVQHFSFVLTNVDSKFLYGFCRHAPDSETSYVILSYLPWHELFYRLLNHCSGLITGGNSGDLWTFLQVVIQSPIPAPGTKYTVTYGDKRTFVADCPNHLSLPSIPENRNISEYYSAIDVESMMIIFASMLNERRIIVTSDRVSRLSACIQAANSLIYPMSWQHIFIPVLPQHLLDYLNAPMPFLIGVAWPLIQKVRLEELGDLVLLNADTNQISTPFTDLTDLPEEIVHNLKKNLMSPNNNLLGDAVSRSFLKALVGLIGNYREALQFRDEDRKITFNQERFLASRPNHLRRTVEKMLELQIFRQFIEERLDLLNSGLHTSDDFELEVSVHNEKSSSKMKQMITNVKKESGAIIKNVKNKTNPAMKSAVKSVSRGGKNVKEKSKNTYKGFSRKFKANSKIIENSQDDDDVVQQRRSAPSSPTLPPRLLKAKTVLYEGGSFSTKSVYKRERKESVDPTRRRSDILTTANSICGGHSSADSEKTPSPQGIDLMGEVESALRGQNCFIKFANLNVDQFTLDNGNNSSSHKTSDYNQRMILNGSSLKSDSSTLASSNQNVSVNFGSNETLHPITTNIFENNTTTTMSKSGSSQDLIFLENPQDEVFDPLLAKDIPTPLKKILEKDNCASLGITPGKKNSTNSLKKNHDETPNRLNSSHYLPFSSYQPRTTPPRSMNGQLVQSSRIAQNPLYLQPVPRMGKINSNLNSNPKSSLMDGGIYANVPAGAFKSDVAARCNDPSASSQNTTTAIAFAASLLSPTSTGASASTTLPQKQNCADSSGAYVEFLPCFESVNEKKKFSKPTLNDFNRMNDNKSTSSVTNHWAPNSGFKTNNKTNLNSNPIRSEVDLLGDFSADFRKLSVSKKPSGV